MRLFFTCLLLFPILGMAQEKPLAKAVTVAKATSQPKPALGLFTPNGTTQAPANALDKTRLIYNLTLNNDVLGVIRSEKRSLLEISIPTADGTLELELVPANLFAPGFTVKMQVPDPNFTVDITKILYYHGIIKNNPNSVVAIAFSEDNVVGMIADSTGNRILAKPLDKLASATAYAFYNEKAVTIQSRPFTCGTVDDAPSPAKGIPTNGPGNNEITANSCYIEIYAEADYAMYQYWNSNSNTLAAHVAFLFNQVITLYQNENVIVRLKQLSFWNATDPYASTTNTTDALNQFKARWNGLGNNFPGQMAHLLTSRNIGGGKADFFNGLADRSTAYAVSGNLSSDYGLARSYPTYAWETGAFQNYHKKVNLVENRSKSL